MLYTCILLFALCHNCEPYTVVLICRPLGMLASADTHLSMTDTSHHRQAIGYQDSMHNADSFSVYVEDDSTTDDTVDPTLPSMNQSSFSVFQDSCSNKSGRPQQMPSMNQSNFSVFHDSCSNKSGRPQQMPSMNQSSFSVFQDSRADKSGRPQQQPVYHSASLSLPAAHYIIAS